MKKLIIFLPIILLSTISFGQFWQKVYYVNGVVKNKQTGKPVPYVLVVNINKGNGTQTDTAGRFLITMTKDDTLRFSSIGYETVYWTLADKNPRSRHVTAEIEMQPRVYNLPGVNIYAVRWKAFVYEIAHTEVKKDETQERIKLWFSKAVPQEDLKALTQAAHGVGFVIGGKTKYEKELEKMKKLQSYEQIEKKVNEKFNPQLVSKITGLKGKELERFMDYLNFDRDFILETPEYDLIVIIKQIYEEYKKGNLTKNYIIKKVSPFAPKK